MQCVCVCVCACVRACVFMDEFVDIHTYTCRRVTMG